MHSQQETLHTIPQNLHNNVAARVMCDSEAVTMAAQPNRSEDSAEKSYTQICDDDKHFRSSPEHSRDTQKNPIREQDSKIIDEKPVIKENLQSSIAALTANPVRAPDVVERDRVLDVVDESRNGGMSVRDEDKTLRECESGSAETGPDESENLTLADSQTVGNSTLEHLEIEKLRDDLSRNQEHAALPQKSLEGECMSVSNILSEGGKKISGPASQIVEGRDFPDQSSKSAQFNQIGEMGDARIPAGAEFAVLDRQNVPREAGTADQVLVTALKKDDFPSKDMNDTELIIRNQEGQLPAAAHIDANVPGEFVSETKNRASPKIIVSASANQDFNAETGVHSAAKGNHDAGEDMGVRNLCFPQDTHQINLNSAGLEQDEALQGVFVSKELAPVAKNECLADNNMSDADGNDGVYESKLRTKHEKSDDSVHVPRPNVVLTAEHEVGELGDIISVIDKTVVISTLPGERSAIHRGVAARSRDVDEAAALDVGSILCFEDKSILGAVHDTFGPIKSPFYTVRFNSTKEIESLSQVHVGQKVFSVLQHSHLLKARDIRSKGYDSSNLYDEEVIGNQAEFSDDESERVAKGARKRRANPNHTSVVRGCVPKRARGSRVPHSYSDRGELRQRDRFPRESTACQGFRPQGPSMPFVQTYGLPPPPLYHGEYVNMPPGSFNPSYQHWGGYSTGPSSGQASFEANRHRPHPARGFQGTAVPPPWIAHQRPGGEFQSFDQSYQNQHVEAQQFQNVRPDATHVYTPRVGDDFQPPGGFRATGALGHPSSTSHTPMSPWSSRNDYMSRLPNWQTRGGG